MRHKLHNLKPAVLIEGILKIVHNAQCLCDEAELLFANNMFARAYTLSHIAREELAKALMLNRATIDLLLENQVDWKKINRRFRDHKEKIINDRAITMSLFGEQIGHELDPRVLFAKDTVDFTNDRKNASLYVDYTDNAFVLPEDSITEKLARRNIDLAKYRIALLTPGCLHLSELAELPKSDLQKLFPMDKIMKIAKDFEEQINA